MIRRRSDSVIHSVVSLSESVRVFHLDAVDLWEVFLCFRGPELQLRIMVFEPWKSKQMATLLGGGATKQA